MTTLPPPPPLPTAPAPSTPLETLADQLAECQRELKAWTDRRESLLLQFEQLHAAGLAPEKFTSHGHTFSRQQGRTYDYSSCPEIIRTQETLKDLQEMAKASGMATIKPSKATWKVTAPRGEA
jgi:hypothetical protein